MSITINTLTHNRTLISNCNEVFKVCESLLNCYDSITGWNLQITTLVTDIETYIQDTKSVVKISHALPTIIIPDTYFKDDILELTNTIKDLLAIGESELPNIMISFEQLDKLLADKYQGIQYAIKQIVSI